MTEKYAVELKFTDWMTVGSALVVYERHYREKGMEGMANMTQDVRETFVEELTND